jgi:hypothetical protein
LEHAPQLLTSFVTSIATPWQHVWPLAHFAPHAPQLLQSPQRSAHVPLQHAGALPKHTLRHAPQFQTSVCTSTHAPLQHDWPGAHAATSLQLVPQELGCVRSRHAPLQQVSFEVHVPMLEQVVPHLPSRSRQDPLQHKGFTPGHVWTHAPQLRMSLSVSMHAPAQHLV